MKLAAAAAATLGLLMSAALAAQTGTQSRPPMSDQVFKNVQVLKGIPVDDFLDTMGIMSAALGFDCVECHVNAGTDSVNWQFDTDKKRTARRMTLMVAALNKTNFGGRQMVTCWTCHRGRDIPVTMPPIDPVYGEAVVLPDEIVSEPFPGEPSVDQILDKYLQAIGGAARLAAVTSFTATGTSQGFRGFGGGGQVQIYAKAPISVRRSSSLPRTSDDSMPSPVRRPERVGVGAAVRRASICPGWQRARRGTHRRAVVVSGPDKDGGDPAARGCT